MLSRKRKKDAPTAEKDPKLSSEKPEWVDNPEQNLYMCKNAEDYRRHKVQSFMHALSCYRWFCPSYLSELLY